MLDIAKVKSAKTDKIGFFRFKKFDKDTYLITNDAWKYEFLNIKEFELFISGNFWDLEKYESLVKKGFIKTDDYEQKMTWSVSLKNHFIWVWPTLHMIVITLRCNHKCKYCHAAVAPMTAKEFDMSKQTAKKVVDTILYTNSPSLTIEFQGWESLVNYEVVQYVTDYAKTRASYLWKQIFFSLVSNLTLMTEEKLTRLLDNGVDICTSLDGNKLTHNSNRSWYDGDSFDRVTYWMKRVDEEKQKRNIWKIGALLTVTKETLPKYKEIIDTYIELGLESIFLRWLNPYGFAASAMQTLAYESDEWINFYQKSLDYIIELNKSGTFFKESITTIYLMKIFNPKEPAFMDIRSPSGIWIWWVAYNYDWKIYASDESRMLGRMWDNSFFMTEAWDNAEENYKNMVNSEVTKTAIQSSTLDGLPWYNEHVYKPYFWVDIIHNYKTVWSLYNPIAKDEKIKIQIAILDNIFEKLRDKETRRVFMSWLIWPTSIKI
jgi:uncharacterized protein